MNAAPKLTPERMKAETEARIRRALAHIQQAQDELNMACGDLSAICGGIPVWKATSKLSDRVRALWYKVDGLRQRVRYANDRNRIRLDDVNVEAILREDQLRPVAPRT